MPDAAGKPTGYAVEILQHVAANLGWRIRIDYMPWARVEMEMRHGKCDIAMTVLQFSDYAKFMHFPNQSILEQRNVLVVLRDRQIHYDGNLENFMRHNTVGLYADKRVNEEFETLRQAPWARVDIANRADLNLDKLLRRRFDAAIENDLSAIYELRKTGRLDEVEILSPPLSVTPAYIVFSKATDMSQYVKGYDEALGRFKKTQAFKDLTRKYLPDSALGG